jgi:hypothetical protein
MIDFGAQCFWRLIGHRYSLTVTPCQAAILLVQRQKRATEPPTFAKSRDFPRSPQHQPNARIPRHVPSNSQPISVNSRRISLHALPSEQEYAEALSGPGAFEKDLTSDSGKMAIHGSFARARLDNFSDEISPFSLCRKSTFRF